MRGQSNIGLLAAILTILLIVSLPIQAAREQTAEDIATETHEETTAAETFREIKETIETTKAAETTAEPTEEAPALTYYANIPLEAELQDYIVRKCEEVSIEPFIIFAMIFRESSYKVECIGDGGDSFGLMQIQPKWHYERMTELNCLNLLNPYENVTVGIDYLSELLEKHDGDIMKALTAYNAGHYKGEITQYAKAVMSEAERICYTERGIQNG